MRYSHFSNTILNDTFIVAIYAHTFIFRCDFGYTGAFCENSVAQNPTVFLENLEGTILAEGAGIHSVQGAELSYDCDVVSTGKAAVFNQDGRREFVTSELNTTNTM